MLFSKTNEIYKKGFKMERLTKIEIGGNYTCIENSSSVEVLEFKDFDLVDDSYQSNIKTVVYVDEDDNMQSMELNTFSKKHG